MGFLWIDSSTNDETVYYTEAAQNCIRRFQVGGTVQTIAGTRGAAGGFNRGGIPAKTALLNGPTGIVGDGQGNIYFCDSSNHRIRRMDKNGIITTVCGTGRASAGPVPFVLGPNGSLPTAAVLDAPQTLRMDSNGNLLITA